MTGRALMRKLLLHTLFVPHLGQQMLQATYVCMKVFAKQHAQHRGAGIHAQRHQLTGTEQPERMLVRQKEIPAQQQPQHRRK